MCVCEGIRIGKGERLKKKVLLLPRLLEKHIFIAI